MALRFSRRDALGAAAGFALRSAVGAGALAALPDKASFPVDGTYLDSAFTHPVGAFAASSASSYVDARRRDPQAVGPRSNPRRGAVERFARLINASPSDIAVVPSTLVAENLVTAALDIGPRAGVVTDALHYDGSLALYGELRRRDTPVAVVRPRGIRIDMADLRATLTRDIRLIAISLVSSTTGFLHDLAEVCALAHARGILVYADLMQAAGAMPVDVKASGVDFAACSTYKWLMGDFGVAFLYVRPDRIERLRRVQVGWRQVVRQLSHLLPFESPGPALGEYELASGAAGLFEVSTPAWGALAVASAALDYILTLGVETIARHRAPLAERLVNELTPHGFIALSAAGTASPIVAFAARDAGRRFGSLLEAEQLRISVYEHRIRVSPSVFNDAEDVSRLVRALTRPTAGV